MVQYRTRALAVTGGELRYAVWGRRGPVILASHGLTASHMQFQSVADQLGDEFQLVAPDHRGRGHSRDIRGPWGMSAHAEDILALLDDLQLAAADLMIGHSMGGFVAAVTAARAPQRIGGLLLIDGGLPSIDQMPEGLTTEQLVKAITGPAVARLDVTFSSVEDYLAFWRAHPAFASEWSPYVEQYARYDLIGTAPELRARTRKAAIIADVETQLKSELVPRALASLRLPVSFLQAPRGVMNAEPLYAPELLASWARSVSNVELRTVPDVNHYTIVISERGAIGVAAEIKRLLQRVRDGRGQEQGE